ncbi:hypothetical protein EDD36DRAFT_43279 [Exophiala viscosa]|uniref:Extracellular membrane protein CFEM domain-containing protein n=1 Tax=Exophiala viscosa TaxID=2486360 RepID=A0AAN6E691_9EURO|nr:hypothetical protein EDD36DRAFT_43279 [Exophiala viscosa]
MFSLSLLVPLLMLPQAYAVTITAAPNIQHLHARQGASADPGSTSCDVWFSIEASCTAATSDFLNLAFSQEASCLCYSGTVWQPSVFDNAFQTCLDHLSTASPSAFSAMGGTDVPSTPCAEVGDVVATPALLTSSSATTVLGNSAACDSWNAIEFSCSETISSFTNLPFSVEASCLCYSSSTYAPFIYDDYQAQCLAYLSTASTSFYSYLSGDEVPRAPCSIVGNVASGPVAATTTTAALSGSSTGGRSSSPALTSSVASVTSSNGLTTTVPTTVSSSRAAALLCRPVGTRFLVLLVVTMAVVML